MSKIEIRKVGITEVGTDSNGKQKRCVELNGQIFHEIYHPSYTYASVILSQNEPHWKRG